MRILVDRVISDDDTTLSHVYIDGRLECDGLEDEYREDKIPGETRIPAGIYKIGVRTVGGFHNRYKNKYPFHRGMLQILDVPGFDYILIHTGNTDDDTAGCLVVGAGRSMVGELRVISSVHAYTRLYQKVIAAALAGNLTIEYRDSDNV